MKTYIFDLINAALFTSLLQNVIFTGGFGATETIRMAAKPNNLFKSAVFVTYFSVTVTLFCKIFDFIPAIKNTGSVIHGLIFAFVLLSVYSLTLAFSLLIKCTAVTKRRLSVCALNSLVLSLPYISYKSTFSLYEALGSAIGASVAYVLAIWLLHAGMNKLRENESIPEVFKGNAALFMYTAILSLAFAGLSGKAISL